MALVLAESLSATSEVATFNGELVGATLGDMFRLDDEVIVFRSYWHPLRLPALRTKTKANISRSQLGTERSSHAAGTPVRAVVESFSVSDDELDPGVFGDASMAPDIVVSGFASEPSVGDSSVHASADHVHGSAQFYITPAGGIIIDVPTDDPGVAGQLWSDSGVLTISAGPP